MSTTAYRSDKFLKQVTAERVTSIWIAEREIANASLIDYLDKGHG
jgi:hypothetical protein